MKVDIVRLCGVEITILYQEARCMIQKLEIPCNSLGLGDEVF
jgi:hypothetical protein